VTLLIGAATMLQAVLISAAAAGYLVVSAPLRELQFLPPPRHEAQRTDLRPRIGPPDVTRYTR
jgi:hypothetical protein